MSKLPTSAKILFGFILFLILGISASYISTTKNISVSTIKTELIKMKVENVDEVLEIYTTYSNKDDALNYLEQVIADSNNTLTANEKELFGNDVLTEKINTDKYSETTMFIKYNKLTITDEEFDMISQYIKNENKFPIKIIYETMDSSNYFGKIIFNYVKTNSTKNNDESDDIKNLDNINIPKAFLVVDGKLVKTYEEYSDMELK